MLDMKFTVSFERCNYPIYRIFFSFLFLDFHNFGIWNWKSVKTENRGLKKKLEIKGNFRVLVCE